MTGPSEVATTPEQVGTRISLARTFRNLGVTELATRADIDADRLVSIEKGEVCPTLTKLSVLAHALKVPVAEHGSGVTAITAPPPGAAKVNWSRRTQALSTDPAIWESPGERVGVSRPTS